MASYAWLGLAGELAHVLRRRAYEVAVYTCLWFLAPSLAYDRAFSGFMCMFFQCLGLEMTYLLGWLSGVYRPIGVFRSCILDHSNCKIDASNALR